MFTPKNRYQLDHQHKKFVELSLFSCEDLMLGGLRTP